MKTRVFFLFLLFLEVLYTVNACPYYTMTPSRTNYTNFTTGVANVKYTGIPLRFCDGAEIPQSEISQLEDITYDLTVIGDTFANGRWAVLTMISETPVFRIKQSSVVTFQTAEILFNITAFYVYDTAILSVSYVRFWSGQFPIIIQTFSLESGLQADHMEILDTRYGVYRVSGGLVLHDSLFAQQLSASIVTATSGIIGLELFFVTIVQSPIAFGVLITPQATVTAQIVDDDYLLASHVHILPNTADVCNPTPSQTPAADLGGGIPVDESKNKDNGNRTLDIIVLIVLAALLVVFSSLTYTMRGE